MEPKLSRKQKLVILADKMYEPLLTINEGAVRSGKTVVDNVLWKRHIKKFRGKDFIITGYSTGTIERNIVKPFYEMFGEKIRLDNFNSFDYHGNKVHCFGSSTYDAHNAMTGLTAHGWYANEVTLQHPNTIQEGFDRCSGEGSRMFWDTNPDFPDHPIKVNYIDKSGERLSSGRLSILAWHWKLEDNEFLPRDYIENLKLRTQAGTWYNRKILGQWVGAEGLIWDNFDIDSNFIPAFDPPHDWPRWRAIDFGYDHPFVCLWLTQDYDGRIYVYREYVERMKLIKAHAESVKQLSGEEDYYNTVSDHDAQERAEYEANDVSTTRADKNVTVGIQRVAEYFQRWGDGKPRLMIMSNCPETKKSVLNYRWAPHKPGVPWEEKPLKIDDDPSDALRYGVMEITSNQGCSPELSLALSRASPWSR